MSGVVVAIVANLEKKIAEDNVTDEKLPDVNNIKDTMAGPLATPGDLFFLEH
jgi:mannose/fructose/N-acetylgalactosamine-specific phosphotransferase system component IID